ncbi:palmitoyltransferase ZDHHC23 isoform X2 [Drosophila nasuta]|uniref:palmitoyltransferase ZDHHC23 isoform X2 n=1 Tax=Drosophila nasuta TaxID=42062 RepID=UPI00295EC8F3|nr:palmitoyltransferase ZDHHC23 isoform X2 [Drosophila nasuta]
MANFFAAAIESERSEAATEASQATLCCCEYVAEDKQPFHMLGCCCNCEDFDLVCTRLITCKRIEQRNIDGMLIAFQDRLRLPWRGGAKRISPAALAPAFIVPLMMGLAALNAKTGIVLMLTLIGFTSWGLQLAERTATKTTFFLSWIVFSIVYMVVIFEFEVPLLELLPEENYILLLLSGGALYALYRTKKLAPLNLVTAQYGTTPKDELPGITEASSGEEQAEQQAATDTILGIDDDDDDGEGDDGEKAGLMQQHRGGQPNICESCRKVTPRRAYHCAVCGSCVKRRSHHSYWLNCCIGERNYRWYLFALALSECALLLGANLTLTAVCHPFLVVRLLGIPLLLPDDCSEVFEDFELGISFVVAAYAILISGYITFVLVRQLYLWYRGTTLHEFKRVRPSSSGGIGNGESQSRLEQLACHAQVIEYGIVFAVATLI